MNLRRMFKYPSEKWSRIDSVDSLCLISQIHIFEWNHKSSRAPRSFTSAWIASTHYKYFRAFCRELDFVSELYQQRLQKKYTRLSFWTISNRCLFFLNSCSSVFMDFLGGRTTVMKSHRVFFIYHLAMIQQRDIFMGYQGCSGSHNSLTVMGSDSGQAGYWELVHPLSS